MTKFFNHLHVILNPFFNALCFNVIAQFVKVINLLCKIVLYQSDGCFSLLF